MTTTTLDPSRAIPDPVRKHNASTYRNGTCPTPDGRGRGCAECRAAAAAERKRIRAARRDKPIPADIVHGAAAYGDWKCRCDICREGHRDERRRERANRAS